MSKEKEYKGLDHYFPYQPIEPEWDDYPHFDDIIEEHPTISDKEKYWLKRISHLIAYWVNIVHQQLYWVDHFFLPIIGKFNRERPYLSFFTLYAQDQFDEHFSSESWRIADEIWKDFKEKQRRNNILVTETVRQNIGIHFLRVSDKVDFRYLD